VYQRFYGLRDLPFELTPNPSYLFFSARHREALSNLEYGLSSAKALTVLVGEAGTGKTTLLRAALESERCRNVRCVILTNPALSRGEFIEMLAHRFDLGSEAAQSKTALLEHLDRTLRERRSRGEITALVIDEAQSLSVELLEEVRLLANIETATEKLLPLVLAGQPELATRLNDPALRQLKQRVALRCEIGPFELPETAAYIASRIKTAGGEASRLFTREAVMLIHEYSRGIPRTISVMCDNALLGGMALGRRPVDREVVTEVCRDFDLQAYDESIDPALPLTNEEAEGESAADDLRSGVQSNRDEAEERRSSEQGLKLTASRSSILFGSRKR
jgi:type II secretory pathway predicted ATPase ExeA